MGKWKRHQPLRPGAAAAATRRAARRPRKSVAEVKRRLQDYRVRSLHVAQSLPQIHLGAGLGRDLSSHAKERSLRRFLASKKDKSAATQFYQSKLQGKALRGLHTHAQYAPGTGSGFYKAKDNYFQFSANASMKPEKLGNRNDVGSKPFGRAVQNPSAERRPRDLRVLEQDGTPDSFGA